MRTCDREQGFTYLGLLILLAIMGIVSAVALQVGAYTHRRVAEEALLHVGREYSEALESYRRMTPVGRPSEPEELQDLLKDPRYPGVVRHLRKLYHDPITGRQEWGLQRSQDTKRIIGVYSLSDAQPIKIANFDLRFKAFMGKTSYQQWVFNGSPNGAGAGAAGTSIDPRTLMEASGTNSDVNPARPAGEYDPRELMQ